MSKCVLVDCAGVTNSVNPPQTLFMNDRVLVGCADGSVLSQCSAPASYPPGVTFDTGAGKVAVAAGTFGSNTLANANALALIYGTDFIAGEVLASRMVCGGSCTPALIIMKDMEVGNVLPNRIAEIKLLAGVFYACSDANANLFTSVDGLAWTARAIAASSSNGLNDIIFAGGQYVIAAAQNATAKYVVLTSPDALNWTNHNFGGAPDIFNRSARSVAYGAGLYVVCTLDGNRAHSADAATWTVQAGLGNFYNRVRFINGNFYMLDSTGTIEVSPDGINWIGYASHISPGDIAYGAGLFIAVDRTGNYSTSPDGTTWTLRTPPGADHFSCIQFGNGRFVAGCNGGNIYSSLDGLNWTLQATAAFRLWSCVYVSGKTFELAELH